MAEQQVFHYWITESGHLGEEYIPQLQAQGAAAQPAVPGGALASLLAGEEEDPWDEDVPGVSGEAAWTEGPGAGESARPDLPLTADFAPDGAGGMTLLRWPRLARPARLPERVKGRPLTAIGAAAFAPVHIPEEQWDRFYTPPVSFSVFCMRMGRLALQEERDEGGPTEIDLPPTVRRIGPYSFWRCTNLERISLPPDLVSIPAGCFGECCRLQEVILPNRLEAIGWMPASPHAAMPDTGAFSGCCGLRELTLPQSVRELGAYTFNSTGLVRLRVVDEGGALWSRRVHAADNAFEHTAALLWMEKLDPAGRVSYGVGLPPARDKILAGDPRFGKLLELPRLFLKEGPDFFDRLARDAFRLDFSARMALARLQNPLGLEPRTRRWYLDLLVQYFDRAPQFMPETREKAYTSLFDFLESQPGLTAADLSCLVRAAGCLSLPVELLSRMIEMRTSRFDTMTGFEDLELD